jgi:predicted permease
MFVTYSENNTSFESLGVYSPFPLTVTGSDTSEQVRAVGLTHGVMEALRVRPMLGRAFTQADFRSDGASTVILGWGYWQRRFGGDPSIVGRTITSDGRQLTVIGVMPRGFSVVTIEPDVLVPQGFDRSRLVLVFFQYQMVGRLKPGVSLEQANADLARLTYVWGGSWPMPPGYQGGARPFDSWRFLSVARPLKDGVVESVANLLWVLMATIGIVMLIACANVANLVLVRSEGRQQDFAVRMALGAGRGRLVAEWVTESVMLGLLGGALGTALAYGGVRALQAYGPGRLPRLQEIGVDGRVLVFVLVVSVLSGILFGLIPAFRYAAGRLSGMLSGARGASDSRERARTRNGLVVAQVALALVLLVSAGLMIRTSVAMRNVAPGFDTGGVQTIRLIIPPAAAPTAEQVAQTQKALLSAFAKIPGVTATALSTAMPMEALGPNPAGMPQFPVLSERDTPEVSRNRPLRPFKFVSPDYFRTVGTPIVAGREYTWSDLDALQPVAIVSRTLAVELWGSPDAALGQRVRPDPNASWRRVIGVAADVREAGAHRPPTAVAYWPSRMEGTNAAVPVQVSRGVTFAVRSERAGDQALIDAIRQGVSSVSGSIPITVVRTMREVYDTSMAQTSFVLVMLGIAAVMALTIGLIGIYGVVAYAVARRTREVGVRMALGAQQRELRRMFLRHALLLTGIGVGIGLGGAAALTRVLASQLFEVRPVDPLTYLAVALLLMIATFVASYIPARRASNLNPVAALRAD